MNTNNQEFSAELRALQIVHLALTAGMLFFGVVMLGLWYTGSIQAQPLAAKEIMIGICAAVFVAMVVLSRVVFKKKLEALQGKSLAGKLSTYRSALITRCAFLEATAFLSIALFYLNAYLELMIFPALTVLYMLVLFPTRTRVLDDLKPDFREMAGLE